MSWSWLDKKVVLAIHDEQISEHGGQAGLRDEGLLDSALARPINKAQYETVHACDLAASYGYGLSRNHAFIDGNKRTALVALELFLVLNGWTLKADDMACLHMSMSLADGALSEQDLAAWLKANAATLD